MKSSKPLQTLNKAVNLGLIKATEGENFDSHVTVYEKE